MPHAVIEFSRELEAAVDLGVVMTSVHNAMLESGEFGEKDIKIRMYPCDHALVAGTSQNFVHSTIYLLSGRSKSVKKALTERVLGALMSHGLQAASISVDARDLDRDVYSKVVR